MYFFKCLSLYYHLKVSVSVTQKEIFNSDDNSSNSSNSGSQSKTDWQGPPIFQNNSIGVAAWPNKDKNGDWYLRIDPPFFDAFNLFVNDDHEGMKGTFNKFCENFNQK